MRLRASGPTFAEDCAPDERLREVLHKLFMSHPIKALHDHEHHKLYR
jgi:hypothetical protein